MVLPALHATRLLSPIDKNKSTHSDLDSTCNSQSRAVNRAQIATYGFWNFLDKREKRGGRISGLLKIRWIVRPDVDVCRPVAVGTHLKIAEHPAAQ